MKNISITSDELYRIINENETLVNQKNQLETQFTVLHNSYLEIISKSVEIFKDLPINPQKIIFISYDGKGYSCNPKYIAEEILRRDLTFDLVWLVNDLNATMPDKIRKVPYDSFDALYELATAKVIVTNEMTPLDFHKKPSQYFIMTWHACWTAKYVNLDLKEKCSPQLVNIINSSNAVTDLMLAGSEDNLKDIRRAFGYQGEVLSCGLPRQDIFFKPDAIPSISKKVKSSLHIQVQNKILLYAPTFRDNDLQSMAIQETDIYRLNFQRLLNVLEKSFGGKWNLLCRLHPIFSERGLSKQIFTPSQNIIDVTDYPDVQELMVAADAVLTDYSSVIYDFMLQNKPVFILAKDLTKYDELRGLHPNYFEMPFEITRTEDELFACIKNFNVNKDKLKKSVQDYLAKLNPYGCDGTASAQVVDKILDVMKTKGN